MNNSIKHSLVRTCIAGCMLAAMSTFATPLADVVCCFELGENPAGGAPWLNANNTLEDNGEGVSLGNWNDRTGDISSQLTGGHDVDQGNPTGVLLGFSNPVTNGPGNDLRIHGNAMAIDNSVYYWSAPGYIEVASETTPGQTGATVPGWTDDTFYMIMPYNYDEVGDPRHGPLSGIYEYWTEGGIQHQKYPDSWGEDLIAAGGSQLDLYGYADWNPSGDKVDISDAIDLDGEYPDNPLADISYVRIRTATNDDAGIFGSISTEVMHVEDISVIPEPTTLMLILLGGVAALQRRRFNS